MQALNLKLERIKRNLNQSELAEALGTKPQSISNWENSISVPHYSKMKEIEEYFQETIAYLFSPVSESEGNEYGFNRDKHRTRSRNNKAARTTQS